jgi:hypothetical protein
MPPSIPDLDPRLPAWIPMPVLLAGVGCLGRSCCSLHLRGRGVAPVAGRHSVGDGPDVVLTSDHQRATREPAFPTPVPGQERRCADLRLHEWEEVLTFTSASLAHHRFTASGLQHFVTGGAAICCPKQADPLCYLAGASTTARALLRGCQLAARQV